ncbi:hypothetical protein AB4305_26620, partial [Nocardia sp. 2YAB30]|uniref:hypothetical protein n=1 Tax=Nocardia sp. 2YAB30 TaxID=3233022 RepID=UPI003F9DAF9A
IGGFRWAAGAGLGGPAWSSLPWRRLGAAAPSRWRAGVLWCRLGAVAPSRWSARILWRGSPAAPSSATLVVDPLDEVLDRERRGTVVLGGVGMS